MKKRPALPEEILGSQCGVRLGLGADPPPLVTLMIEDDGYWHEKNFAISAFWLDDLIDVLQRTKRAIAKSGCSSPTKGPAK